MQRFTMLSLVLGTGLGTIGTGCVADPTATTPNPPPPRPPTVTSMSPATGPYGSDLAILGRDFGAMGSVELEDNTIATVTAWSDDEIHVRVPFPSGPTTLEVSAPGGYTTTPEFTPTSSWAPGPSLPQPATILATHVFGATFAGLGLDLSKHVQLQVIDRKTGTTYAVAGVTGSTDPRAPTRARLVADDHGAPAVLAGVGGELNLMTIANATLSSFDTGIAGTLIAAGRDGSGMYAWLQIGTASVERVRPGTAGQPWHVERGPISSPNVLDAAVASDGTLVIAYSQDAGSFFDNMAKLGIERLAPAGTTFGTAEYPDNEVWDDYIASARMTMATDGMRMVVAYSTQENDENTDHEKPASARGLDGTWSAVNASSALADDCCYAYTPSSIATVETNDGGVAMAADMTATTSVIVPVWPAIPVALASDDSGRVRPLIAIGQRVWFPTPPGPLADLRTSPSSPSPSE